MSGKSIPATSLPVKNRLPLKLAALFITAFLVVFISGMGYDLFATSAENRQTDADSLAQPALKPIEPKIESDLAKVLAFDSTPTPSEIKDPFSDRGGISSNAKTAGTAAPNTGNTNPSTPQSSVAQANSGDRPGMSGNPALRFPPQYNPGINAPTSNVNYLASTEATNERIRARQERMRLGQDGGSESVVLAVDDLLPVGVVSGGKDATEILLYSQALMQTFSFPVGTRFYDGWLVDWRAEGVGFGYDKQNGAVFLKTWARSVKQPNDNNSAVKNSPNG